MARPADSTELLKCSFCGKTQKQVRKLIAGPGVYICDDCISLCNEIIAEELSSAAKADIQELPKPSEIFAFLNEYVIGQDPAKRCPLRSTTTTSGCARVHRATRSRSPRATS